MKKNNTKEKQINNKYLITFSCNLLNIIYFNLHFYNLIHY